MRIQKETPEPKSGGSSAQMRLSSVELRNATLSIYNGAWPSRFSSSSILLHFLKFLLCLCVCGIGMCVQVHVFSCRGKMEACYPFLSYFHETGSLAECRAWHFPARLVPSKNQQFCCPTSKTQG